MDETTKAIIERITQRYPAPKSIGGGKSCHVFFDCIKLTPSDLARLAAEATGDLHDDAFDVAIGIAYTGIFFAAAVAGGREVAILQADGALFGPVLSGKRVVLVDDVVHTGSNMKRAEQALAGAGATVAGYVCIIDRSGGAFGSAQKPLWSAHQTVME